MVSNYCQVCDKDINRKFKQKHIKSKAHLNMYYNIITNKYNIGDVYWSDIETIIHEYIKDDSTKFCSFTILFRCKLNGEDISISDDGGEVYAPLYRFDDSGWVFYRYCKSKKMRDYIFHRAMLSGIKLDSSSIISNVTITFFSKYRTMTTKHRFQQPRRVLEFKLLKHIKNMSNADKMFKYSFLTLRYELLFS